MIGKTPALVVATRPLADGVISDFEVTEKMLKHFIEKVHRESFSILPRPRVVIGIPMSVTEVERKAVEDAALNAGARQVFLIEEPMAAAVGARLPIQTSTGNFIVDIGGGTTEIAVISLGGIVSWKSLRVAGNELDSNIIQYARDKFNLLLGDRTAEQIKIEIGSAYPDKEIKEAKMRGRDLITGLPKEVIVNSAQIQEALARTVRLFAENIKSTIELTPPELVADIYERGIVLSGGGALLRGLDKAIQEEVKIPVHIIDDPLTAVVRGTGLILEDIDSVKDLFVLSTQADTYLK
jgi:rod shape-determining protein MreB